jgi:hypothetical protein
MSDGRLEPIIDDETAATADVRRHAIRRQSSVESDDKPSKIYQSQLDRRQRSITITLPEYDMREKLESKAAELSKTLGKSISMTRLATILLVDNFDRLLAGEIELTEKSTEIQSLGVKRKP